MYNVQHVQTAKQYTQITHKIRRELTTTGYINYKSYNTHYTEQVATHTALYSREMYTGTFPLLLLFLYT